jgi:rubredoxin
MVCRCPRCKTKPIQTSRVEREVIAGTSFLVTIGKQECPKCGVTVIVRIPHMALDPPTIFHNLPTWLGGKVP